MNRYIIRIVDGIQTSDGAGVKLKRIIGSPELSLLDPFLLFDEFGSDNPQDYIAGFPPHPHRGFETITYMLNGKFRHKDSAGNEGFLSDGSVQWMTAGRGVIHSEMPEKTDGKVRGFQLWLNLPKKLKMIEPSYNDIPSEKIPSIEIENGNVKIISGEFNGVKGPGMPHTGMLYLDVVLNKDTEFKTSINEQWNTFVYVYDGVMASKDLLVQSGQLAIFSEGNSLNFSSYDSNGLRCVVISGEPLNEPVSRGGPFVMNTKAEVLQAFEDYQKGVLVK